MVILPVMDSLNQEKCDGQYNLLASFKQLVRKKEYSAMQTLFLEYFIQNEPENSLSEIWECIHYLTRPTINLEEQAKELAQFLAEYLIERNNYKEALDHIRQTAYLLTSDRKFRQAIRRLYQMNYANKDNLVKFIQISGLEDSVLLPQVITILDKLLSFDIGNPVYSTRSGYGEVTKIDFLLDTLTINFFSSQSQTITLEQALTSLKSIPTDNIFYLQAKKSPIIAQLAHDNPVELKKLILRDLPENHKTTDIKQILKDLVSDDAIDKFIEYLKKTKPKSEKKVSNDAQVFDYSCLPSFSADKIVDLMNSVPGSTRQKIIIELKKQRTDWQELYLSIFFTQSDKRTMLTIFTNSSEEIQKQIISKSFTEYKSYSGQFMWLTETKTDDDPYVILTRYLDLSKQYGAEIRKRIINKDYKIIRIVTEKIKPDIVERTIERIKAIDNFYPEELDIIEHIFTQKFPSLLAVKEDYIYHTATAINNKEDELRILTTVDVPKIAEEIGRARGYGDLSENFEYKAAMEKQKRLMNRISVMRNELAKAKPIDFNKIDNSKVNIGTIVKLMPVAENSLPLIYTILGPWDSDVAKGIISYLAPFAQNLLNKTVGDEITDDQNNKYKITEISRANF
jgi:transcription elongation GreA/GreB family factor